MNFKLKIFAAALIGVAMTCVAQAQFYKLHNGDLGLNITAPISIPLTENGPGVYKTTDSAGFLMSLRDHPVPWAGIEINGGFATYGQRYTYVQSQALNSTVSTQRIRTDQYELTGGYLMHLHTPWVQPFLVIGGGGVDFMPAKIAGPNQWRSAGMYEFGFDLTSRRMPHMGWRIQQHALIYRAPTYNQPLLASRTWVHQSEPSLGFYFRW